MDAISTAEMWTLDYVLGLFLVLAGCLTASALSTVPLMRLSRFHTLGLAVMAVSLIVHGLHHFVIGDVYLGPASDIGYGLGAVMLIGEHLAGVKKTTAKPKGNLEMIDFDKKRLTDLLTNAGYPEPTDVTLHDAGEEGTLLTYSSNTDRRDAAEAAWDHVRHVMNVNFDGDPQTDEINVSGIAPNTRVVIRLTKQPWKT